jgi:hypothetical protein
VPLVSATRRKLDVLYARDFAIYQYLLDNTREQAASKHRNRTKAVSVCCDA